MIIDGEFINTDTPILRYYDTTIRPVSCITIQRARVLYPTIKRHTIHDSYGEERMQGCKVDRMIGFVPVPVLNRVLNRVLVPA